MAQIITIDRKQWVVGLDWNSYSEKPDNEDLSTFADKHEYEWAAVRLNESVIQGGFCEPIDGIKRPQKIASLAAFLADSHEQPWIGIYQISEGLWWYIAVRDGHAILPDGDIVGGKEAISEVRDLHAGYGDWNYLEGTLDDLIERMQGIKARRTYLRPLKANGPTWPQIATYTAVVLVIAGAGFYFWHQRQLEIERENEIAAAKVRAQLAAGQKIQPAKSPLLDSPTPNNWLEGCKTTLHPLPLSFYGWAIDKVACEGTTAIVFWKREPGATVADRPAGNVSDDGETVIQKIEIEGIQNSIDDDSINLSEAVLKLRAWAQQAGLTLTLKGNQSAPLPGSQPETAIPTTPQLPFSLETKTSPFGLDFTTLPGVRIQSVSTNNDDWHLEGNVYGR